MTMNKKLTLIVVALLVLAAAVFCLALLQKHAKVADIITDEAEWDKKDAEVKPLSCYADIINFIVDGFETEWEKFKPEDQGLSPVYSYSSEYAGYVLHDINDDGVKELILGDQFDDDNYQIYDIFSINGEDKSLIHLACGGERDTFSVNAEGVIIETGSNSAEDSFQKAYTISNGALVPLEDQSWNDSQLALRFEKFAGMEVEVL